MKPSDRSLEIAVIGLGQAGGNLAAEFSRRGYRAMALNTAQSDLLELGNTAGAGLSESQRLYIGLDGYDGAGADLNYGLECITENADRIREAVTRHADAADLVVLTAGLGGGTGSAISELVKVLEGLQLPLITLSTLPGDHESGIAKVNAVRAVSELVKIPDLGLIFADNARLSQLHGNVTLDEYFERVNEVIIQPLDAFNQLNGRDHLHPIRTLDGEDLRTLLTSTGVLNYAEGQLEELSVDTVSQWVGDALQSSRVMPSGFALDDLAYIGLILEASAETLSNTPFTFFNEVGEHLKTGTSGAGIYMGVYRDMSLAPDAPTTVRLLASTPTLPGGISAIVSDAQREGSALRDKLSRSVSTLDLGEIANFDLLPNRPPSLAPNDKSRRRARNSRRPRAAGRTAASTASSTSASQASAADATTTPKAAADNSEKKAAAPKKSSDAKKDPAPAVQVKSGKLAQPPGPPPNTTAGKSTKTKSASRGAQPPGPPPGSSKSAVKPAPHSSVPASAEPGSASASSGAISSAAISSAAISSSAASVPVRVSTRNSMPPESLDPAAETGDKSEPETYDRLVDAFINTESTSIRRRIATRLHTSRNSDHPLARFYANRAIERLVDAGEEEALESVMSSLGA